MLQYTLKRLLLIPPTFFFVSVVIFFVLNIAPGRPGEQAQLGGEREDSQAQQESYRIFKEQFNLDKPILFNLRPGLSRDDVEELLSRANNLHSDQRLSERIEAKNELEDLGNYLVRHLIAILETHQDPEMQRLAARQLTQAAQRQFTRNRTGRDHGVREQNKRIGRTNQNLKDKRWKKDSSAEEVVAIKQHWAGWWKENQEFFEYTTGERLHLFVFDTRFAKYWGNLFALDFGLSTVDRRPVLPTILSKLKYSLSLTLVSVILAYLIAIPIGIFSAVRQNTKLDGAITLALFVLYSLPTFFTGTVLLRLLTEGDPVAWFPTGGFEAMDSAAQSTLAHLQDVIWHLILPVATYTSVSLAALSRYARTGIIDVIRADYVRTARAKGLHEFVVIIKHAARNGMIPILTLLGSLLPVLISGSVVIEVIFNIPGMGLFLYDSINLRDYNAVMAILVIASLLTLLGILVSDLSYAVADPRISFD
jgi:peptide/nickel transport system permease protein